MRRPPVTRAHTLNTRSLLGHADPASLVLWWLTRGLACAGRRVPPTCCRRASSGSRRA
jgi:hypothetical protein